MCSLYIWFSEMKMENSFQLSTVCDEYWILSFYYDSFMICIWLEEKISFSIPCTELLQDYMPSNWIRGLCQDFITGKSIIIRLQASTIDVFAFSLEENSKGFNSKQYVEGSNYLDNSQITLNRAEWTITQMSCEYNTVYTTGKLWMLWKLNEMLFFVTRHACNLVNNISQSRRYDYRALLWHN